MKKTISMIAKLEGKKSQTSIGNIKEVVNVFISVMIADAVYSDIHEQTSNIQEEFQKTKRKKIDKAFKILSKQPDISFEELARKILK